MVEETVKVATVDYEAMEADSSPSDVLENSEEPRPTDEIINETIQEYTAKVEAYISTSSQYAVTVAKDVSARAAPALMASSEYVNIVAKDVSSKAAPLLDKSSRCVNSVANDVSSKAVPILRKSSACMNTVANDLSTKAKQVDWTTVKSSLPQNWDVTRSIRAIFFCSMLLGTATYMNVHANINIGLASIREEAGLLTVQRLRLIPTNEEFSPRLSPSLPTCKSLMQDKGSPYHSGDFLTRRTVPVSWTPRADHSRELHHSMCELHRYTAEEARQCLAGKHISMIGDSLTRYQYFSLAYFLHNGKYPPRFERDPFGPCRHKDENGFLDNPDAICGGEKYFGGYMESNSIRTHASPFETLVENYFYATPAFTTSNESEGQKQAYLSYNSELGWSDEPTPIHGFTFTGCAFHGGCTYSDELVEERLARSANLDFDFSQPLEEAIGPDGILRHILPPVDIALYNRGLWGALDRGRAERIFPQLYNFSQGENGRCYYRGTNPRFDVPMPDEPWYIRHEAFYNGCGYIDHAHLVADFTELPYRHPSIPNQKYGNLQDEREFIYWDAIHFRPWVYEELNNMLLNILCNNA